jgi:RNA polymerase sigma-70 factor (ECF subfamily)
MIARGMRRLRQSAEGGDITEYHLQAGIAACHAIAPDYGSTDWASILSLYDRLTEFDDSPVVALNRAVAVANLHGPREGMKAVSSIRDRGKLAGYHLFYAVIGELEMRMSNFQVAAEQFRKAFELAETKSERRFLLKRIQDCEPGSESTPSA